MVPPSSISMAFSVFFTIFLLTITASSASSFLSDFNSLVALKQGFHFPEPALPTWNTSNPTSFCLWKGIRCSRGRLVSLDLSNLNLSGSVSPLVSTFEFIVELSLAGNNLAGPIKIENSKNLRLINISNNQFGGDLDWDYSTLPSLEVFDANNNNLTALLPKGIVSVKGLRVLNLGGNYFSGEIPARYGELSGLEYLVLEGNDLRGKIPTELGNLSKLREIYLGHYNVFDGGIPRELGNLESLVVMDLSSCELDGEIPPELGNLRLLDTLYLHTNQLSGLIPRRLGNLSGLVYLDLSNNALAGEIPAEFVSLKKLKLFNLFINKLHGSIPEYVAEFPGLETLGLWMNNFTGTIPRRLGLNGRLGLLDLSSNKLTGTIPPDLCSRNQLQTLILLKNFLFGPIPEGLGTCSGLVRVRMGQNYLNGTVPAGLVYLPRLTLVELQNNYLSGTLSENSNSGPVSLEQLNLANNRLSGPLPSSLSNFSSLQILLLGGNQFSGAIPPAIGDLHQALKIDLSQNLLSGEIPIEIGNCYHLAFLDLSQNKLAGAVPPEISNLRILNYLNVSKNHLDQSVPTSLGTMKSLTTVDFSDNDLTGMVPELGQFAFFNASSFAGNPRLCGALVSNPCNGSRSVGGSHRMSSNFKLLFALGLLVCSLVFAAAAIIKAKSFKKPGSGGSKGSWKLTAFQKIDFTVSDVLECVKAGNVIGRGGAGIVYHGKMPNGVEIAVKKLLGFGPHSHDHGFRAEIQTLGNIRHRNIVRLLAFCSNKETKMNLLVYEYMRNGSLGEALHGKKASFLGWQLRLKIAVEAAKGLCYLHHDCAPLIVHRDVKANNILLDSNFEAHVADFGLAKFLMDGGASECMSAIAGSYGYIAPEYAYTLRVDEKSDVYSFGVVLLELLTGHRPVGDFDEGVDIVQWSRQVTSCRIENVNRILDPRLTSMSKEEVMHIFFVTVLCIQDNSVERPTMREVVQMLSEFPRRAPSPSSSIT